jgi:pyridoxine 5-phosphate synthase
MVRLSVNVNKVATLRNSRGGRVPSVVDAVRTIVEAGAPGITVHPRADARHITSHDVLDVAAELKPLRGRVEFNIEGDVRTDLMALVHEVRPDQCTLVPVLVGEVTSQGGWPLDTPIPTLRGTIASLKADGIRVSVFIDAEAGGGPVGRRARRRPRRAVHRAVRPGVRGRSADRRGRDARLHGRRRDGARARAGGQCGT